MDIDQYRDAIAAHHGKVVLVDFWATWCPSCVQQFPHIVEIARQYTDRPVAVVSVSMDVPDSQDEAREFLRQQDAQFQNFISIYGVGSAAMDAFEIENGSLPHYKLYDYAGRLRYTFSDFGDGAEGKIEELLAEQSLDEMTNDEIPNDERMTKP